MSSFRVQLDDVSDRPARRNAPEPTFNSYDDDRRKISQRPFLIAALVALGLVVIAVVAGLVYYQTLKSTPQYSLALLVDAAKRDDKQEIASVIDVSAVVDDFVPQITAKAVELYGRGQPPQVIARAEKIAQPILPAVKERARAELPRVIRSRTERFGYVPFFAMVVGAEQYLDIKVNGDTAIVRSKIPEHQLEMKMKRIGNRWQIVGVTDEQLATDIARKIGQEVIAIAAGGRKTADSLGIGNLSDLIKQAEELVK